MAGWVYILASAPYGALYIGVTADLPRRAFEHREGIGSQFTKRYGVHRLVHSEWFEDIQNAIIVRSASRNGTGAGRST